MQGSDCLACSSRALIQLRWGWEPWPWLPQGHGILEQGSSLPTPPPPPPAHSYSWLEDRRTLGPPCGSYSPLLRTHGGCIPSRLEWPSPGPAPWWLGGESLFSAASQTRHFLLFWHLVSCTVPISSGIKVSLLRTSVL